REFAWDIEQQVAILIQQTLLVQEAGMTQIAALLRMQPRTLQRRLAKAGTQFRTVLINTRHHMACHYLTVSSMPVTQIARLLGYQELANFSRAFKALSGVYPTLYRQKQTERH
ncbi:MAG: helix-turn-helix transcriptional regulator, partial [Aestuariibacter sp.]|nr:helix-turn-helix transcriptional regulator [Aestuariibacter sp.]